MTYPTKSLNFLQNTTNGAPTPAVSLEVLVIGAGLGGLATAISLVLRGHHVEVLEQADKLGEVTSHCRGPIAGLHTDVIRLELASRFRPIPPAYCSNGAWVRF